VSGRPFALVQPNSPPIALGFQFKNIWDNCKTPKAIPPLAPGLPNNTTPSAQPKCQIAKAVHMEVKKEHEGIAVNLIHKALHSTAFRHTMNLMTKLVPLFLTAFLPWSRTSFAELSQSKPSALQNLSM